MMTMGHKNAKTFLSTCPTNSLWFEHFCKGCFKWMGQEIHQDLVLSIRVILTLIELLETQWRERTEDCETLALVGAFAVITYGDTLRGN